MGEGRVKEKSKLMVTYILDKNMKSLLRRTFVYRGASQRAKRKSKRLVYLFFIPLLQTNYIISSSNWTKLEKSLAGLFDYKKKTI